MIQVPHCRTLVASVKRTKIVTLQIPIAVFTLWPTDWAGTRRAPLQPG